MTSRQAKEPPKWWTTLKAIAYELKPFTLPTRHDLVNTWIQTRATAQLLWREAVQGYQLVRPMVIPFLRGLSWRSIGGASAFLLVYSVFIRMEFGTVFFILSSLGFLLTYGLGDTRGAGDMSTWSVFNRNFTSLLGTLQAEQFENEIMHRDLDHVPDRLRQDADEGSEEEGAEARRAPEDQAGGPQASRKSGKKARRKFDRDERKKKREAAAAGGAAIGDDWDSDD